MNPMAEVVKTTEFPPMDQVRKKLLIRWYRCPIDGKKLQALSKRSDARGFFQALGHLALWLTTGVVAFLLFKQQAWIGFIATLFLHGTVATFFTAPHHELCHRTVFKTKWLNEFFLMIFSLLGWLNCRIYEFSHTYHHRYTLHLEGDREEVLPVKPSLRILYLLQLFTLNVTGGYQSRGVIPTIQGLIRVAMNKVDKPFNSWGTELYEGHDKERRQAVNWARTVLVFHTVIIAGSFAMGEPILAVLISGSTFIANWLRYFVGVPMHCGLQSNTPDFRKCVRTITLDPLSQFLYWHMNWHLEHHMFAGVPCYNLKKLHHEVADDMPKPRTLVGAWKEMRETWRRQRIDPDYVFDTPVPSSGTLPAGNSTGGPLASSIGGLAPKGIAGSCHGQGD